MSPLKRPTKAQVEAGCEAASAMMNASIQQQMGGLGGCKHFDLAGFPKHLHEIIRMYLDGEIFDVEGIYMAMRGVDKTSTQP